MATEGKIVTLLNDDKTMGIFPKTKTSAVSDNDGKGLDAIVSELKESIANRVTQTEMETYINETFLGGAW